MPAERLPPGLYERLLSLALDRDIQALDAKGFTALTEAPDDTERPRLLARYVHDLLSLALNVQRDAERFDSALSSRDWPVQRISAKPWSAIRPSPSRVACSSNRW